MTGPELSEKEKKMADTILNQMGLDESDKYKDDIDSTLNREYEENQEFYENADIVDKPEFIKKEEELKEKRRIGDEINPDGLIPLKNRVIIKMEKDREKKTDTGIILADLRPVKQDTNRGEVFALNDKTKYSFNIGSKVVVDLRYVRHRFHYNNELYFILDKDGVIGSYE